MKVNEQRCNVPNCLLSHLVTSTSSVNKDDLECPVCLEAEEGEEIAMMRGCNHIGCSDCIGRWMETKENSSCPFCRTSSPLVIFSRSIFRGEERRALFREHTKCQLNHPDLKPFVDHVDSQEWRTFIGFVMNSEDRLPVSFYLDFFCQNNNVSLRSTESTFFTFSSSSSSSKSNTNNNNNNNHANDNNTSKAIVHLRLPGLIIQIVLSRVPVKFVHDPNVADEFVGLLNDQWRLGQWKLLPHLLNKGPIVIVRNFGNVGCYLSINRFTSSAPVPRLESGDEIAGKLRRLPNSNARFDSLLQFESFVWSGFLMEVFDNHE